MTYVRREAQYTYVQREGDTVCDVRTEGGTVHVRTYRGRETQYVNNTATDVNTTTLSYT